MKLRKPQCDLPLPLQLPFRMIFRKPAKSFLASFIFCASFFIVMNGMAVQPEIQFERFSIEDGLSQSSILTILQDSRGFMWFGTYNGLNRFDGYHFKVFQYDPKNPRGLIHPVVKSIVEDQQGNLWIGTEGGLCKYHRDTEDFTHYVHDPEDSRSLSHNKIRDVCVDSSGTLWIATLGGLNRYNPAGDNFIRYQRDPENPAGLNSNAVREVYEDTEGNLWIGTDDGVNLFNRKDSTFTHYKHDPGNPCSLSDNNVLAINEDRAGQLWFGTWGGGLNRLRRCTGCFDHFFADPFTDGSLGHNIVRSIYEDRDGVLWIGTFGGGLNRYVRNTNQFIHFKNDPRNPGSISHNAIYSIYEDRSGVLWIGTDFGGLNKLDKRRSQFKLYTTSISFEQKGGNNPISVVIEDPYFKRRVLWIGTLGNGLFRYDRERDRVKHYQHRIADPNSLASNIVRDVFIDHAGAVWIGTDMGLDRFYRRSGRFRHFQAEPDDIKSISHNNVYCLYEDHLNQLWVGTYYGGLDRFNRDTGTFVHYNNRPGNTTGFNDDAVWCIMEDHNHILWVGTDNGGLNRYHSNTDSFTHYLSDPDNPLSLSSNKILCLMEDESDRIWVGTQNGLNKFDTVTETFVRYDEHKGLSNHVIQSLVEDKAGTIWMGTVKGLVRFHPDELTFEQYTSKDGLQSDEFSVNACSRARDGELFFGGIHGWNAFYPDSIKKNDFVPPVVITGFQVSNRSVSTGDVINGRCLLKKSIIETDEIKLSYKDDIFSFEFAALSYNAPEDNQYAYRLEGFEEEWNYVQNRRFATYTNIPSGKYLFHVKASNNDDIWNEQGIEMRIIIEPPFWKTLWFQTLAIIVIVTAVVVGHHIRIGKIQTRNKDLETINLQLQNQIVKTERAEKKVKRLNKNLEDRVKRRTKELETVNKELESFAYTVSHDLRAPLRHISGYSQVIMEEYLEKLDDEGKNVLKRLCAAANHMSNLIDALLILSRVTRRKMVYQTVRLDEIAERIIHNFIEIEPERNVDFHAAKNLKTRGDSGLLYLMLENLLENAWKFTKDRKKARIEFGVLNGKEAAKWDVKGSVFFIKDNGVGFDMAFSSKLFEAFGRLHSTSEYPGTGIGLATVFRIVQRHEGSIWAEGEVNKGATFYFTFP